MNIDSNQRCQNCTKETCCCLIIDHNNPLPLLRRGGSKQQLSPDTDITPNHKSDSSPSTLSLFP
jgi:hypothetical protein